MMKRLFLALGGLFFLVLCFGMGSAATTVSACSTISSAGTYEVNQTLNATVSCMNISAGDVVFDCLGNTIFYDTSGGNGGVGIHAVSAPSYRNITIQNCRIIKPQANGTTSYGIFLLNTNNSIIFNNTISTNGTTDNYGIYMRGNITFVSILQNLIDARGSGVSNFGIHAQNGINSSLIANNTVNSTGSGSNFGITLAGTAAGQVYNTSVVSNTIKTTGSAASNYGIYINISGDLNTINNNTVYTNGTSTNYGIHLLGAGTTTVNNTQIANNYIVTNGTAAATTNDYGIYLSTSIYSSNISYNTVTANGPTRSMGIHLVGTTTMQVNYNQIFRNNIITGGTSGVNWGIHLTTNANHNLIQNNSISTTGSTTNYGIHLLGVTTSTVNNNTIIYNIINTSGTGASNHGIFLSTNTSANNISENLIQVNGTTTNYGIYVVGAAGASSERNSIGSNIVNAYGYADRKSVV